MKKYVSYIALLLALLMLLTSLAACTSGEIETTAQIEGSSAAAESTPSFTEATTVAPNIDTENESKTSAEKSDTTVFSPGSNTPSFPVQSSLNFNNTFPFSNW